MDVQIGERVRGWNGRKHVEGYVQGLITVSKVNRVVVAVVRDDEGKVERLTNVESVRLVVM